MTKKQYEAPRTQTEAFETVSEIVAISAREVQNDQVENATWEDLDE